MLLLLLLSYIQSFQNSVLMLVSPSYVVFFTGSLGLGPKELWGKCHPATLQIKARKRGAHSTAVGQERIPILLLPALVIVFLGGY